MKYSIKLFSCLLFSTFFFFSCLEGSSDVENEILTEDFVGNYSNIFSTNKIEKEVYVVENGYWNEGEIFFSINANDFLNVSIKDIVIISSGNFGIVSNPFAIIRTTHPNENVYRTDVRPSFWVDGPINFNKLIYGGEAFYPEYYLADSFQHIVQGGYLTIDNYNKKYISGKCWIKAWVYNTQLNREVSSGIYIEFKGLPYKD